MKGKVKGIAIIILVLLGIINFSFKTENELNIYVSADKGSDANTGTLTSPLKTIAKAKALLISLRRINTYSKVKVNLMPGNYFVSETLVFRAEDGGSASCPIQYTAYGTGDVIISGGVALPKRWVRDSGGKNLWKLKIENLNTVNQLFANGERLPRSHSPTLYTKGPINLVKEDIEKLGLRGSQKFKLAETLKTSDLMPFCSFAYNGTDLNDLTTADLENAELNLYHSWQNSFHKIDRINKSNGEVYLKSLGNYPVGFFSNKNRYFIENCKKFLNVSKAWFYDKQKGELWYVSNDNQNPNSLNFVVPNVNQLLNLVGNKQAKTPVSDIQFKGIQFQYTVAPRGVHLEKWRINSQAAAQTPWLDFSGGFTGQQVASSAGQAARLYYTQNVSFDNCRFLNLGGYAIKVDSSSNKNRINNCQFYNLGGGGVIIGYDNSDPIAAHIPITSSPAGNELTNSVIHDIGLIYKSSVAVAIMNANTTNIAGNEIYNTPYTGISTGWRWKKTPSYTNDNVIKDNKIHRVMQEMADGGGVYTLGTQKNTQIADNTIYDVDRNKDAVGSRNNAIFFDEGSSRIAIDNNKIFNIKNEPIRYNESDPADIEWGTNEIDGVSYTGNDGSEVVSIKKLSIWATDNRLKTFITKKFGQTNWNYVVPIVIFATLLFIYLIVKRRKRRKRERRRAKIN